MMVDPQKVRDGAIDGTEDYLDDQTRKAIAAYRVAAAKPGGPTSVTNLIQTLFELYPATPAQIAAESGELATLDPVRIEQIRTAAAEDVLYVEIAQVCQAFGMDLAYLHYPRANGDELDPCVAHARSFREANPDMDPDDILRGHLLDYARTGSLTLPALINTLCKEVFCRVRVPDPEDVQAFLTGLNIRPAFLDAAAGDLLGYPYHVWTELWGDGWWRNDLRT